jgi:hypothetical protein
MTIVVRSENLLGLEIRVRSRPGRGFMFAIELLLVTAALSLSVPTTGTHELRPRHIALVEDNDSVRDALINSEWQRAAS